MSTLKLWVMPVALQSKRLVSREITNFQEQFAGIEVKIEEITWDVAWNKIIDLPNNPDDAPDIIQLGSTWNGSFASLGILKDITELINSMGGGESFVPASWSSSCFPQAKRANSSMDEPPRVSSLPWFVDIRTLYYRDDVFSNLGLNAMNLETWDTFMETCQKLHKKTYKGRELDVLGLSGKKETLLVHNLAPWVWGAGGDFISEDGKTAAFNSEPALRGIEFFLSLNDKQYISRKSLEQSTEDVAHSFCVKGDFAMSLSGAHCMPQLLDPNSAAFVPEIGGNCIASLFPAGPSGRFVFCGGSNLAITTYCKHIDEAWNLLKYFVSFDSQNRFPRAINMLPSLLESFDATFITDENRERGALKESWRFGRAFPNVPAWGEIELLLIDYLAKIWQEIGQGKYDFGKIKNDINEAAQKANELLAKWEVK
ncbi:MAG: extracellular solute-binding protein [bacterium]